jgi:acyl-CoA synthetase (AMP-forming)/AMP-acid ligase II
MLSDGLIASLQLTHSNLLNNALSIGRCMRLTHNDILCGSKFNSISLFRNIEHRPILQAMSHHFSIALISFSFRQSSSRYLISFGPLSLVLGNLAAWSHGACVVYPSDMFNPKRIVDAVLQEKCTALHGVPTHFLGVLSEVERRQQQGERLDLSNLRCALSTFLLMRNHGRCIFIRTGIAAGSPIPIDLMKQLITKLNLTDLTNAYGMSESVVDRNVHQELTNRL